MGVPGTQMTHVLMGNPDLVFGGETQSPKNGRFQTGSKAFFDMSSRMPTPGG